MKVALLTTLCFILFHTAIGKEGVTAKLKGNIAFRKNVGQIIDQNGNRRNDVHYKLYTPGLSVFVGNGSLHYQWNKTEKLAANVNSGTHGLGVASYRLDVTLQGTNPRAEVVAEEQVPGYESYQLYNLKGAIANAYRKITYKNVYPSIDWVLYVRGSQVKYDFIVHEGGDVEDIRILYEGASDLNLQKSALVVETPFGRLIEQEPYAFEESSKKQIGVAYKIEKNLVSFTADPYNGTLVIDPALLWATYFGGSEYDYIWKMSTDQNGNAYAAGETFSMSNIATVGAHQVNYTNLTDAFIAKFNSTGALVWATYYGGSMEDVIFDITVSQNNLVYVSGHTKSNTGIGTANTQQPVFSGNTAQGDAFVACFTDAGSLVWGTYYGALGHGSGQSGFRGVAVDNWGNVYATGGFSHVSSANATALTTPGSYQPQTAGAADMLLVKLNSAGQRIWSTYYGGSNGEAAFGVAADGNGKVYIVGSTRSTDSIATQGTWQTTCSSCVVAPVQEDAFIIQFDSAGDRQWGTYFGGEKEDQLYRIECDAYGSLYVVGRTTSFTNIASPGAHQVIHQAGTVNPVSIEGMIAKFSNTGQRIWSTFYGGEQDDEVKDIALKMPDGFFVVGDTWSQNAIATDTTYGGMPPGLPILSMFMAKFDSSGQRLYGTYYGGTSNDLGHAIAYNDGTKQVFFGGHSQSAGLATPGAYQQINLGGAPLVAYDGVIVSFLDSNSTIPTPNVNASICANASLNVVNNASGFFGAGNIFSVELSDSSGSFSNATVIGSVPGIAAGTIPCFIPGTIYPGNGYRIRIVSTQPIIRSISSAIIQIIAPMPGASVTISASPGTVIAAGAMVTFTANVTNGGSSPTYQWKKNSVEIAGATNNTYTTNLAASNDSFSVEVQSSNLCAPGSQSNILVMQVVNSVPGVTKDPVFEVSPNPFDESFSIANEGRKLVHVLVTDVTGKRVTSILSDDIEIRINLGGRARGVYFYKIMDAATAISGKIIKR